MASSTGTRFAAAAVLILLLLGAGASSSSAGETTESTTTESTTIEETPRTLTVNVSGEGQVTVSPPGTVCPPACSPSVGEGEVVTLSASASEGFEFDGWNGTCPGSGSTCILTVSGDMSVEAAFSQDTTTIPEPPAAPPPSEPGSPSPAPTPGASPPPSAVGEVDRMLARLASGCIVFNELKETLAVGESKVVQLLLSTQRADCRRKQRRLKQRITELGEEVGSAIKVANVMEAHLTGPRFKILAVREERQAISRQDVTEWKWEIEPTEAGTHRLYLRLSAIIRVDGSPELRTIRTYEKTFEVRVTFLSQVSSFVEDNWQWLWTAILIPAVGWFASRRRKRAEPSTA